MITKSQVYETFYEAGLSESDGEVRMQRPYSQAKTTLNVVPPCSSRGWIEPLEVVSYTN